MDDHIPIEEEVFVPNPLIVADIIFDSPKPANTTAMVQRRGSEAVMNYTRHPDSSDSGEPHVHFEDGKTTRLKSYEPPMATPPQYYPQQPQAAYPFQQQQQPPYQQQPYFPPPPNQGTPQMGSSPMPIPPRRDSLAQNRSVSYAPQYQPQAGPYGTSPMAYPPQPAYGSWPQANYYPQPPAPTSNSLSPWQQPYAPNNSSVSYLPGPGPTPGTAPFYPPRSALRNRTSSSSSYASHSSNRYNDDDPIYESDEDDSLDDRPKRHRRHSHTGSSGHHHHHRTGSYHGDRHENKYTGSADHASLGDTLSLIWDGLSGAMGKSRRY